MLPAPLASAPAHQDLSVRGPGARQSAPLRRLTGGPGVSLTRAAVRCVARPSAALSWSERITNPAPAAKAASPFGHPHPVGRRPGTGFPATPRRPAGRAAGSRWLRKKEAGPVIPPSAWGSKVAEGRPSRRHPPRDGPMHQGRKRGRLDGNIERLGTCRRRAPRPAAGKRVAPGAGGIPGRRAHGRRGVTVRPRHSDTGQGVYGNGEAVPSPGMAEDRMATDERLHRAAIRDPAHAGPRSRNPSTSGTESSPYRPTSGCYPCTAENPGTPSKR